MNDLEVVLDDDFFARVEKTHEFIVHNNKTYPVNQIMVIEDEEEDEEDEEEEEEEDEVFSKASQGSGGRGGEERRG